MTLLLVKPCFQVKKPCCSKLHFTALNGQNSTFYLITIYFHALISNFKEKTKFYNFIFYKPWKKCAVWQTDMNEKVIVLFEAILGMLWKKLFQFLFLLSFGIALGFQKRYISTSYLKGPTNGSWSKLEVEKKLYIISNFVQLLFLSPLR